RIYGAKDIREKPAEIWASAAWRGFLCVFLVLPMLLNVNPYRAVAFGIRYPLSFYLLVIVCLVAAIVCLIPAIKLRLGSLRMQVSENGPLLGSTELTIEPDGLVIDRRLVKSKYTFGQPFRALRYRQML